MGDLPAAAAALPFVQKMLILQGSGNMFCDGHNLLAFVSLPGNPVCKTDTFHSRSHLGPKIIGSRVHPISEPVLRLERGLRRQQQPRLCRVYAANRMWSEDNLAYDFGLPP